jgi:hypothetical protein
MLFFNKTIMFIIQAVLVIAAVLVFSLFDPFNLFNRTKISVKNTPVVVESMRDIGELITAEYYGEVMASSLEEDIQNVTDTRTVRKNAIQEIEQEVLDVLDSITGIGNNRRKLTRRFNEKYPDIAQTDEYSLLLEYAKEHHDKNEKELLMFYYASFRKKDKKGLLDNVKLDSYLSKKYPTPELNKKARKKNLVLLGRGSVKAGIDFKEFSDKNFRYVETTNTVQLLRSRPRILRHTINPWFIPKKKIPGFEFLHVGSKVDHGQVAIDKSMKVKQACLDQLREDALKANILEHAKKNAEVNLAGFFSIIMGKPIKVQIFGHPLEAYIEEVLNPQKFSAIPYAAIDSLIAVHLNESTKATLLFADSVLRVVKPLNVIDSDFVSAELLAVQREIEKDPFITLHEQSMLNEPPRLTDRDMLYFILSNYSQKDFKNFADHVEDTTTLMGLSLKFNLRKSGETKEKFQEAILKRKMEMWSAYQVRIGDDARFPKETPEDTVRQKTNTDVVADKQVKPAAGGQKSKKSSGESQ